MTERYADMMDLKHILLSIGIKSTAVLEEEPCTSLDEPTFDCLSFGEQQLQLQGWV
jgi:hypothetical protein